MAENPANANQREAACTALGCMKATDAVPARNRALRAVRVAFSASEPARNHAKVAAGTAAVGQLDVEHRLQRTLRLELEAGDGEHFIRNRRDAEVADAQSLELEFGTWALMEEDGFERVNLRNGARQVECTINGIGERAGNCSLEEVVMAVRTRRDVFPCDTRIDATQIVPASKLVSGITGFRVDLQRLYTRGSSL